MTMSVDEEADFRLHFMNTLHAQNKRLNAVQIKMQTNKMQQLLIFCP
jgi:hypothetical protein